MHETEHVLWFTALLNRFFAAPAEAVLRLAGLKFEPGQPWANFMAMEVLVILVLMAAAAMLRFRLSVDKPGTFQLTIEAVYGFLAEQARDIIGHGYQKYIAWFCTLFIFILTSNLLGVVPTFESPTMYYYVPAGLALCTFLYYNGMGLKKHGLVGYLKEFAGPMWWLAWFMFPLELISHFIRPVSLTIRLYANMLAGEKVTIGFLALVPFVVPVAVMALHVFVSFLQAFIFTILSIAYVGSAVAEEE
jgi:F-type H+-transporting ATPase subunit a